MSDLVEPTPENKPDKPACRCGSTNVTVSSVIDVDGTALYHCNACGKNFLPPAV